MRRYIVPSIVVLLAVVGMTGQDLPTVADTPGETDQTFWVRHAYLLNIAKILAVTIGVTCLINLVAWVVAKVSARIAARVKDVAAGPVIKRVRTLVYFAPASQSCWSGCSRSSRFSQNSGSRPACRREPWA